MVITISRTYGSGGRVMGKVLAEKLGYKFYDREFMRMVSDDTGINEALLCESDEKLGRTYIGVDTGWKEDWGPLPPSDKEYTDERNLFRLQAEVIKRLADTQDCIIMGRCANAVLWDRDAVVRVLCYASEEDCLKRTMEVCGLEAKEAQKRISKVDKFRKAYYHHFTGKNMEDSTNYDLCINTGSMTLDALSDIVIEYVKKWQDNKNICREEN